MIELRNPDKAQACKINIATIEEQTKGLAIETWFKKLGWVRYPANITKEDFEDRVEFLRQLVFANTKG